MSGNVFDLKDFKFTKKSDVVDFGTKIFNDGNVSTFNGDDYIIGEYHVGIDFAASISTLGISENAGVSSFTGTVSDVTVFVDGIENKGKIDTNNGSDTIKGTATAIISATAQTVSDVIAVASTADAAAITASLAAINVNANANGINNSFGTITTKNGSDAIKGDIVGYAEARADASAFVTAIATAPISEGLTAFAGAIAESFAQATIIARGINNKYGKITTGNGKDILSSYAKSSNGTDAGVYAGVLAAASPENQALAMAIIEATAMAQDVAIGIDNTGGLISTGNGDDTIEAFAESKNKAIGIFGGKIDTGNGNDTIKATSFGGGVNIQMGKGDDLVSVDGFGGNATVDGGKGFDEFQFGFSLQEFKNTGGEIVLGSASLNELTFTFNGESLNVLNFEQFKFNSQHLTFDDLKNLV